MTTPNPAQQQMMAELDRLQRRVTVLEGQRFSLFEGTDASVFIVDPATLSILDANANAVRRMGYTQAELLGLTLDDIDATDSEWVTMDTESVSVAFVSERIYRNRDGTLMPVEVRSHITRSDGQEILVNFVRDVATLNQAQAALQAREYAAQQFQEKLRTLSEISIDLDQADSFDELCRLAIELGRSQLGFDRLGLWFLDETHEFMVGSFGIDEQGQIRDERDQRFRVDDSSMLIGITGRKIEVAAQDNATLLNDRGEATGSGWSAAAALWDGNAVIGYINTDNLLGRQPPQEYQVELLRMYGATVGYLAKSKRAEQQVRKLSQAVEQSPSIVMITNPAGIIEYVNPRFTQVTGYEAEEVTGKNPRFLKSGDTSADDYKTLWEAIISGDEWRGEFRNRKKSGESYWTLSSISPVKSPEGVITNFVSVQEDITELKQAQQQRLELALEREKVQILGHFIADVAHEFKTPLSIITTGVYLLEKTTTLQDNEHLNTIKEQSFAIDALLDAMLTMSRLDGATAETWETLDLNQLIRTVTTGVESLARGKNLKLSSCLEDLPLIQGNAENLFRALTEILHNAIQYTLVEGAITIQTSVREDAVMVEVKDSGVGLSADERPYIFDRFYRADKARTSRGAGLGLSIAKKVIEAHKGHIEVESAVGKGSIFRVVLPVSARESAIETSA